MWVNMTKKKELNLILQVLSGEITGYSIKFNKLFTNVK